MVEPQLGLRKATVAEREAKQMLEADSIDPGSTFLVEKKALGTIDESSAPLMLTTNVYGLITKQLPVYRYDVTIVGHSIKGREVFLTKKVMGDAVYINRRIKCRDIMEAFKVHYADFLQLTKNCIYYDLQSILYSLVKLNVDPTNGNVFQLTLEQVPDLDDNFPTIDVIIKETTEKGIVTLGDLSLCTNNAGNIDKSLEHFLNLATSQYVMFNKEQFITFSSSQSYLLYPERYGFRPDDTPYFHDNGTYLAIGAQKSVRFVEGPKGPGYRNTAVIIEPKKTPFHGVEPVHKKASYFVNDLGRLHSGELDKLARQLKGLQVETVYGPKKQRFTVSGITQENATQKRILIGEQELTVQQYFSDKYGITLECPHFPLLETKGRNGGYNFYPMEVCIVSDNQRVKTHQQTPRQAQEMIKKCAVAPAFFSQQTQMIVKSLNLEDNIYLNSARVRFINSPLSVRARFIPPPSLEYANHEASTVRTDNFSWQGRRFLIPVKINRWAAYAFCGGARDSINEHDFKKFIDLFMTECTRRGIQIAAPADIRFNVADPERLKNEMLIAAEHQCEYVFVAHPDNADEMHAQLKLSERDYQMITQGVKIGTVRNVVTKGQPLTVSNIVNKTNMKLGGLNFSLSLSNPISREVLGTETLYLGFGMNHPAGGLGIGADGNGNGSNGANGNGSNGSDHGSDAANISSDLLDRKPPSVVGFSANIGMNHDFEFVGDFLYQETRREEKTNIIRRVVARCVNAYRQGRKKNPKRLWVYRNGCSEGQFEMVLKYEIPLIKAELAKLGCDSTVTLVVSNKLQNIRFFNERIDPRAKATDQNIKPGSVVDTGVVHPSFTEFFLNSHRALQGTARTPKYTVLYDDNNLSLDQLEGVTYQLCYGHQIVTMPTSLPSPVYIANRYAERGHLMYRRYKTVTSSDNEPLTYRDLTDRLAYESIDHFARCRINA